MFLQIHENKMSSAVCSGSQEEGQLVRNSSGHHGLGLMGSVMPPHTACPLLAFSPKTS